MTYNQKIIDAYLKLSGRVRGPKANNNDSKQTIKTERAIQQILRRAYYIPDEWDTQVAGGVTTREVIAAATA